MKTVFVCEACNTPVIPKLRQFDRQRFCLDPACQRLRRRQNQRLRRAKAHGKPTPVDTGGRDAEAAVKPHEAALLQFDPAIIGLVSLFIDSTSQQDILVFLRRCAARGQDILFPPTTQAAVQRPRPQPITKHRDVQKRLAA
jgi:hypothetical protein